MACSFLLLACALSQAPAMPVATSTAVDAYVRAHMERMGIPGLALAVVQRGEVKLARGWGLANVEHEVPVTPDTVFQSGSLGKQFTAAAVLLLVEDGKLNLDDPVTTWLSALGDAWKTVSVRHLLSHTSGATDYPPDFDYRRDYSDEELARRIAVIPMGFPPGERFAYSNLGYVVLGLVMNQVTGKHYGAYLDERVFQPAGMKTTRIISEADVIPHRAAGYRRVQGALKNQQWVSPTLNTTADGSLYLTIKDLAAWAAALSTNAPLPEPLRTRMWTRARTSSGKEVDYGMGWSLSNVNGHVLQEHGGAWQGFVSHLARYDQGDVTVVVLANLSGGDVARVAHKVAGLVNPALQPVPERPIKDPEPRTNALVKRILQDTAAGTLKRELLTPEFASVIFPDRVRGAQESLLAMGPLRALELLSREEKNGERRVRYRATYEKGVLLVSVTVSQANLVAGMRMVPEEAP